MRDCLQWLDAARTNAGESLRDQAGKGSLSAPGSTAPKPKIAASGASEGDAPPFGRGPPKPARVEAGGSWWRLPVLRSLAFSFNNPAREVARGDNRARAKESVQSRQIPFVPAKAGTQS